MKFGLEYWSRKTPDLVRKFRAAYIYTASGTLVASELMAEYFNTDPVKYPQWVGISILFVKGLSMLFGVGEEEAKQNVAEARQVVKEVTKDENS